MIINWHKAIESNGKAKVQVLCVILSGYQVSNNLYKDMCMYMYSILKIVRIDILIIQRYKRPYFSTRGCKPEYIVDYCLLHKSFYHFSNLSIDSRDI